MTAGSQTNRDVRNARELCIRIHLGLNPIHDIFELVRVLHDEGREAFEKMRGPRCEYAYQWKPDTSERAATIEDCAQMLQPLVETFKAKALQSPDSSQDWMQATAACGALMGALDAIRTLSKGKP